jgi:hypothetical protein
MVAKLVRGAASGWLGFSENRLASRHRHEAGADGGGASASRFERERDEMGLVSPLIKMLVERRPTVRGA